MFDIATKYYLYLDNNGQKFNIFLLLHSLEKYVNGAIIEMTRLERMRKNILKRLLKLRNIESYQVPRNKNFQLTYLFCDTHFFFICIDKCYKLITQLSLELDDVEIKKLKTRLNKIFDIATIRNHLEHIDDRCMGYLNRKDKKQNIKTHISDFGNFAGNNFSFNNKKFSTNRESLDKLKKIYQELIKILHNKYASKDPSFVTRIAQEKRSKLIQKALQKAGLIKHADILKRCAL